MAGGWRWGPGCAGGSGPGTPWHFLCRPSWVRSAEKGRGHRGLPPSSQVSGGRAPSQARAYVDVLWMWQPLLSQPPGKQLSATAPAPADGWETEARPDPQMTMGPVSDRGWPCALRHAGHRLQPRPTENDSPGLAPPLSVKDTKVPPTAGPGPESSHWAPGSQREPRHHGTG